MYDDAKRPYQMNPEENTFKVLDESGRCIMVCRDAASARQYAVLLNDAFHRGYQAGFRDAKRSN